MVERYPVCRQDFAINRFRFEKNCYEAKKKDFGWLALHYGTQNKNHKHFLKLQHSYRTINDSWDESTSRLRGLHMSDVSGYWLSPFIFFFCCCQGEERAWEWGYFKVGDALEIPNGKIIQFLTGTATNVWEVKFHNGNIQMIYVYPPTICFPGP